LPCASETSTVWPDDISSRRDSPWCASPSSTTPSWSSSASLRKAALRYRAEAAGAAGGISTRENGARARGRACDPDIGASGLPSLHGRKKRTANGGREDPMAESKQGHFVWHELMTKD